MEYINPYQATKYFIIQFLYLDVLTLYNIYEFHSICCQIFLKLIITTVYFFCFLTEYFKDILKKVYKFGNA